MRDFFQEQLNELNRELTRMGAACEEIIALASHALTDWDEELVRKVSTIGSQIDESERTIESICLKLLLRQQPVARDLRQISAAMKMITDMERIGDQAEDIAEIVTFLNGRTMEGMELIEEMARETIEMVTGSVDAFVKKDVELAQKVIDAFYEIPKEERKGRSVSVTVSTSFFVPKPFTPFQWEPQNKIKDMEDKARMLNSSITNKKIVYNWHSSDISFLEEVFAKGDRRLGEVLITAHKLGCKFDGWSDFFDYDKWMEAFRLNGIDPAFYAHRAMSHEEILPWDYADIGVSKDFLIKEHERAYQGITTPSCRESCMGCGAAQFGGGVCFE